MVSLFDTRWIKTPWRSGGLLGASVNMMSWCLQTHLQENLWSEPNVPIAKRFVLGLYATVLTMSMSILQTLKTSLNPCSGPIKYLLCRKKLPSIACVKENSLTTAYQGSKRNKTCCKVYSCTAELLQSSTWHDWPVPSCCLTIMARWGFCQVEYEVTIRYKHN